MSSSASRPRARSRLTISATSSTARPAPDPRSRPTPSTTSSTRLTRSSPYDWRGFWTERLTNHGPGAPLGGIEGSGWKVVYDETPSEMLSSAAGAYHVVPAALAIGLVLSDDGAIADTIEGELAAKAGIGPGMKVVAVNGRRFSAGNPARRDQSREDRHRPHRTAGRKHRLLQNLQTRLPRRRKVSPPGPRRFQARPAQRNPESEVVGGCTKYACHPEEGASPPRDRTKRVKRECSRRDRASCMHQEHSSPRHRIYPLI